MNVVIFEEQLLQGFDHFIGPSIWAVHEEYDLLREQLFVQLMGWA